MTDKGQQLIGFSQSAEGTQLFQAQNPATGEKLEGDFYLATSGEVQLACELARTAFLIYRDISPTQRAAFLNAIADEIEAIGDALVERATAETGLPAGRIQGERGRTCGQLRLFANVVLEGWHLDARIDHAIPDRQPLPKSDLRHINEPLGPVLVFGASNFPLAFSTAGGDTASALAAGCPVIVKAHNAHPGTARLVGLAVVKAAKDTGMPDGTFSLIHGSGRETGQELAAHPAVTAIGFTGSHTAGMALVKTASERPCPIPVYAEMGSTNPVFLLPRALRGKGQSIAHGLAASVTMGCGQF